MIFSAQQLFSDDQAITATAVSTNVIDLGVAGTPYDAVAPLNQDIGKGNKVPFLAQVTEDFNNATSVEVAIETGATTALGTVVLSDSFPVVAVVRVVFSPMFSPNKMMQQVLYKLPTMWQIFLPKSL